MVRSTQSTRSNPFHNFAGALVTVLVLLSCLLIAVMSGCGGGSSSSSSSSSNNTTPPPVGDITVDFSGRGGGVAIPAKFFGAQLGFLPAPGMQTLVANGIGGTRFYANVPEVFVTPTADWTKVDPTLDKLQQTGMKAILEITYTPPWLRPASAPCSGSAPSANLAQPDHAAPTDNNAYASIAAQYVAHIDQKYPGVVQYYEIWNEADQVNQFCGLNPGDSDAVRLNQYKALYQAVAAAMKRQAATDGASIAVGGPALGNSNGASNDWISQIVGLTNNGAKLVDFVSYHQYLAGDDVSHTMTWDGAGGTTSLYARTLDPTTGIAANYQRVAGLAGGAPVIFDEYSDDWDFYNTCCKNSPKYSPVWNTMVFALIANTTYSGSPMLAHLNYYSASNQPFCLLGYVGNDGLYGCGTAGTLLPYPQFRALELLASPNFLGLQANGGNLAKSVKNTAAMDSSGLVSSAFYTPGLNAVVLVNPTATSISNVALVIGNHGLNNPTATQYLLNASTYSATADMKGTALALTENGASAEATVTIPPYSVLAIKTTGR